MNNPTWSFDNTKLNLTPAPTEAEIEIEVEKMYDKLDVRFMNGCITQQQYVEQTFKIDQWAKSQYALIEKN